MLMFLMTCSSMFSWFSLLAVPVTTTYVFTHTPSEIEIEELLKFMELQFEMCPQTTLCTVMAGSIKQANVSTDESCCRECSCDDTCVASGVCCPDYWLMKYLDISKKYNFIKDLRDVASSLNITHIRATAADVSYVTRDVELCVSERAIHGLSTLGPFIEWLPSYIMVSHCPAGSADNLPAGSADAHLKCKQGGMTLGKGRNVQFDVSIFIPVISHITGHVYRNIYCMQCNEKDNGTLQYTPFRMYGVCALRSFFGSPFYNSVERLLQELLSSRFPYCNVMYKPPLGSIGEKVRWCQGADIESCPDAVQSSPRSKDQLDHLCENVYFPVVDFYSGPLFRIVKNVACYLCQTGTMVPQNCSGVYRAPEHTFELNLDFNTLIGRTNLNKHIQEHKNVDPVNKLKSAISVGTEHQTVDDGITGRGQIDPIALPGAMDDAIREKGFADDSVGVKGFADDDIRQNEVADEDIRQNEVVDEDIRQNEVADDDIRQNEVVDDDIRQNEVADEDSRQNEGVGDYIRQNEVADDDIRQNEVAGDDIRQNEVVDEDIRQNEGVDDDIRQNEVADDDIRQNEGVDDDIRQNEVADDDIRQNEVADDDIRQNEGVDDDIRQNEGVDDDIRQNEGVDDDIRQNEDADDDIRQNEDADDDIRQNKVAGDGIRWKDAVMNPKNVPRDGWVDGQTVCGRGYVFDPALLRCRVLFCPKMMVRRRNECVPMFETLEHVYMTFMLKFVADIKHNTTSEYRSEYGTALTVLIWQAADVTFSEAVYDVQLAENTNTTLGLFHVADFSFFMVNNEHSTYTQMINAISRFITTVQSQSLIVAGRSVRFEAKLTSQYINVNENRMDDIIIDVLDGKKLRRIYTRGTAKGQFDQKISLKITQSHFSNRVVVRKSELIFVWRPGFLVDKTGRFVEFQKIPNVIGIGALVLLNVEDVVPSHKSSPTDPTIPQNWEAQIDLRGVITIVIGVCVLAAVLLTAGVYSLYKTKCHSF